MSTKAEVLYEYEAQDADQLSISPGEIIEIIDDSSDLNGWALAKKGDKEGYVPAEYVRYLDQTQYEYGHGTFKPAGFETYYENILNQDHRKPFSYKLIEAFRDVLIPCPFSRYGYTMSRSDLKRGAILNVILTLIITLFDSFSIISPCIPLGSSADKSPTITQILIALVNTVARILLSFYFVYRYPRPSLTFASFPFLNVIGSFTYSVKVYEALEMGDNKEYDGYRYYRAWMWSGLLNLPFNIISLILVITGQPGLIAVSILVLIWNILNSGRCFLAGWAAMESGNEIHPDFEATIKKYRL